MFLQDKPEWLVSVLKFIIEWNGSQGKQEVKEDKLKDREEDEAMSLKCTQPILQS